VDALVSEVEPLVSDLHAALLALEKANDHDGPEGGLTHAKYMRDTVIPAMNGVREVADRLERLVADDLWPLPKYSEMLFIK
jgi:glutamine synthetase